MLNASVIIRREVVRLYDVKCCFYVVFLPFEIPEIMSMLSSPCVHCVFLPDTLSNNFTYHSMTSSTATGQSGYDYAVRESGCFLFFIAISSCQLEASFTSFSCSLQSPDSETRFEHISRSALTGLDGILSCYDAPTPDTNKCAANGAYESIAMQLTLIHTTSLLISARDARRSAGRIIFSIRSEGTTFYVVNP